MIINSHMKSNYHTHTIYCDGRDEPREMIEGALSLGFKTLGFSGHQYSEPDSHYAMNPVEEEGYMADLRNMEEEYGGRIEIFSGIERDYYCDRTDKRFDYVIGSVHHIKVGNEYMNIDEAPEIFAEGVERFFDGDYLKMARAYFDLEREVAGVTGCHIIGHFDLIRKFNEGNAFFDEENETYLGLARDAIHDIVENYDVNIVCRPPEGRRLPAEIERALDGGKPIFEINTGAMTNGRRTTPYPAIPLIRELMEMDVPLILSSDCHDHRFLDYGFRNVIKALAN